MSIKNPHQLVEEFKKNGDFDRLRRELFAQFQSSETINNVMVRVDEIVEKRLERDLKLQYMQADNVQRELLQELNRYPILERALADIPAFTNPEFGASIRRNARTLLQADRGIAGPSKQDDDDADDDDVDMDVDDDETSSDEDSFVVSEAVVQTPNPHVSTETEDTAAVLSTSTAVDTSGATPSRMVNGVVAHGSHGPDAVLDLAVPTPMDSES